MPQVFGSITNVSREKLTRILSILVTGEALRRKELLELCTLILEQPFLRDGGSGSVLATYFPSRQEGRRSQGMRIPLHPTKHTAPHKATPSGSKIEVSSKVGTMMTLLCPQVHLPKWKGSGTASPSLLLQLHPYPEHLHRLQPANHHQIFRNQTP